MGILRNLVQRVTARVLRSQREPVRELVGSDALGNKYYLVTDEQSELRGTGPRREVEYAAIIDPSRIPDEWRQWMTGFRAEPPSKEELEYLQAKRQARERNMARVAASETKWFLKQQLALGAAGAQQRALDQAKKSLPPGAAPPA